ncbi:MFS transporter [Streptomyces sp. NPDC006512]|uniref:MFS transporter n=1 Tax=Streptomyces sp. NPDC006512 TaxID=3154307 RepID=UPI0033BE08A2
MNPRSTNSRSTNCRSTDSRREGEQILPSAEETPRGTSTPTLYAPLRHRRFRRLAVARCASAFDKTMAPVVLAFAVLDIGGSTLDLGLVIGARSLALVAFVLFGGVAADRWPRVRVVQGSGAASALVMAVTAGSVYTGLASVQLLLWLSLLGGALAGVSLPALSALTPQTVPPELIPQANAAARMGANAAMFVGASAAGLLVAVFSASAGIAVDAAVCLVMAVCFLGAGEVTAVGSRPAPGRTRPIAELREGWQEFVLRPWVWVVTVAFALINAAGSGGLQVLGPVVADASFGRATWGFALAAQTVGMLCGALLVTWWRPVHALRNGVALSALEAVPLAVLAFWPSPLPLVVAMFLSGVAIEQFGIAWDVSLQDRVPADRLARIYAYDTLGSYVAIPLGQVLAGPLSGRLGVRATLIGGAALVVASVAGALCSASLRGLVRKVPAPTPPAPTPPA